MSGRETVLQQGFEGQARAMREFGYPDITADMIAEHHAAWLRGEDLEGVIFQFSVAAFRDYPSIFGQPPAERSK